MTGGLYELSGVRRVFRQGDRLVEALAGIDLSVAQGEFLALEGASGSGKTTLLQLLGGLDQPSAGRIAYDGHDLGGLGDGELTELRLRSFGYVFQQFNLIPTLTALENVQAALAPHGVSDADLRRRSEKLLDEVGLAERASHLPSQLSGGEQQRVAIARALVGEPKVVLADEPTGNLDTATGGEIIELLSRLAAERLATVVVATHDAELAKRAPRRVAMRDGVIVAE
ncbi:MAG: putative transport system ATP-binding protein [Gaiellaceae bacterium]|nr:putative transport system ATP-binding protein [Gaiellaceae bacterium]